MKAFLGLLSVIAFLLLVSCEQAPVGVAVPVNADNIRNGSISRADVDNTATPITGLTYNACTRELIDFEGTIHTRRVATEKQDGSTSFSLNLNSPLRSGSTRHFKYPDLKLNP